MKANVYQDRFDKTLLTKERLIELLQSAEQDENGHWYVVCEWKGWSGDPDTYKQRHYFGLVTTVCDDFVKEYVVCSDDPNRNTEHYNRHFTHNDDTFQVLVCKNKVDAK